MEKVHRLMQGAVADNVFPGGVLLASQNGRIVFFRAYGVVNIYTGIPASVDTVYDLASLTKPLATALSVLKLVEKGRLALEDRLDAILADFVLTNVGHILIRDLLYHVSGLPAYHPYFKFLLKFPLTSRKKILKDLLLKTTPVYQAATKTLYSDLGFMLLRWVIEDITGNRLDRFAVQEMYAPLGIKKLFFNDLGGRLKKAPYAATEDCPWRGEILSGKVHDDNTFAVGGIDGQAGLFGNAHDLHLLLLELLFSYHGAPQSDVFPPDLVRLFFKRLDGKGRALGFDTPSPNDSNSGRYFSLNSVGHLGFTGTSFWMDLDRKIIIILLSNRVHPTRANEKIKPFRPRLHDLVMEDMLHYDSNG
jgi:CubicO group peptidase (beta-lactamase class C family)